jgi:hypothetical protein
MNHDEDTFQFLYSTYRSKIMSHTASSVSNETEDAVYLKPIVLLHSEIQELHEGGTFENACFC